MHLTASITKDIIREQTKEVILNSSLFTAEGSCLTSLAPQDSQKLSYTHPDDLIFLGSKNEGKASENRSLYPPNEYRANIIRCIKNWLNG